MNFGENNKQNRYMLIFNTLTNIFLHKHKGQVCKISKKQFCTFGEMHGSTLRFLILDNREFLTEYKENISACEYSGIHLYVPYEKPWREGVCVQHVVSFMKSQIEDEMPFGIELYEEKNSKKKYPYICIGFKNNVWVCVTKKYDQTKLVFRNITNKELALSDEFGVVAFDTKGKSRLLADLWSN